MRLANDHAASTGARVSFGSGSASEISGRSVLLPRLEIRDRLQQEVANVPLMTELAQYLAEVSRRSWKYGSLDCCTFMADWLMRRGFPDAMPDRRGTYSNRREYRAAIRSEGGIVASCRARFAKIGLFETEGPNLGDVALVLAPFATRRSGQIILAPVGAICTRAGWCAVVTPDVGIVDFRTKFVAAWGTWRG